MVNSYWDAGILYIHGAKEAWFAVKPKQQTHIIANQTMVPKKEKFANPARQNMNKMFKKYKYKYKKNYQRYKRF